MAFDFHVSEKIHDNPLTWDEEHLTYVGATLMAVADILYQEGKIIHKLRWGGNWDQDGVILKDQKLWDRPHVELVKP
jgi:peptidoglycan L-alanyl-D-glutamate endopeptidase CwlK